MTKEMFLEKGAFVDIHEPFRIRASGRFTVALILYLRSPTDSEKSKEVHLSGVVKIGSQNGEIFVNKAINVALLANQTATELLSFDAKDLDGGGARVVDVRVSGKGDELSERYSKVMLYIKPEIKRGFFD